MVKRDTRVLVNQCFGADKDTLTITMVAAYKISMLMNMSGPVPPVSSVIVK